MKKANNQKTISLILKKNKKKKKKTDPKNKRTGNETNYQTNKKL